MKFKFFAASLKQTRQSRLFLQPLFLIPRSIISLVENSNFLNQSPFKNHPNNQNLISS